MDKPNPEIFVPHPISPSRYLLRQYQFLAQVHARTIQPNAEIKPVDYHQYVIRI